MYVIVRYGEDQQEIFNPHCKTPALLKSIRDRCYRGADGDTDTDDIELSDENGNIKYLREAHNRYASELLEERETLVLLKVEGRESPCPRYTPLLKDDEAITEDFLARLVIKDESEDDGGTPRSWKKNKGRGPPVEKEKANKEKTNNKDLLKPRDRPTKPEKIVRARSRLS